MWLKRISRDDPDKIFSVFYNVAGATISSGEVAVWDISTSVDGVRVTTPATATLSLVVGAAAEAITDSNYGKFQVYGYNSAVYATNTTDQAIASGNILIPANGVRYLSYSAASDGKSGFFYAGQSFATATAGAVAVAAKKTFIRCL